MRKPQQRKRHSWGCRSGAQQGVAGGMPRLTSFLLFLSLPAFPVICAPILPTFTGHPAVEVGHSTDWRAHGD